MCWVLILSDKNYDKVRHTQGTKIALSLQQKEVVFIIVYSCFCTVYCKLNQLKIGHRKNENNNPNICHNTVIYPYAVLLRLDSVHGERQNH